jgi:hypothetical protein
VLLTIEVDFATPARFPHDRGDRFGTDPGARDLDAEARRFIIPLTGADVT